jgi:DNA-binding MarR family transcriptional regulator
MALTREGLWLTDILNEVMQLNDSLIRAVEALADDWSLTYARYQILATMGDYQATVPDIARKLNLTRQNVQQVANRLEADGFLETFDNPAHSRAKLYGPTDKGQKALEDIAKRWSELVNNVAKGLQSDRSLLISQSLVAIRSKITADF